MVVAKAKGTMEEWLRNVDREKELKLILWEDMYHKTYFWSTFYVQVKSNYNKKIFKLSLNFEVYVKLLVNCQFHKISSIPSMFLYPPAVYKETCFPE